MKFFCYACCFLSPLFWGISCSSQPETSGYNVLFIAVDDLNDWTGFLAGHPQALTPNLDRLAARSMIFERAYCAVPVCNPSRVAIMTGMRASTTGIYHNSNYMWDSEEIRKRAQTLPRYFAQNGYETYARGKLFHHPEGKWAEKEQWDHFSGLTGDAMHQHPAQTDTLLASGMSASQKRHHNFDWGERSDLELDQTADYQTAEYIADLLQQVHEKPFFIGCGLFRPHLPWYLPEGYLEQFPLDEIVLPELLENDLDDIPAAGKQISQGLHPQGDYQRLKKYGKHREAVQAYLASITYADDCLGKILEALENSPYYENTIVVLWGDHGWHLGEKLHYRKFTLWEESNRVPLLIRVPGLSDQGQRCARTVSLLDLYPTLTQLCSLPANPENEGHSLLPLLQQPTQPWPYPALSTMGFQRHSIRDERYRYIVYEDKTEELYDHQRDPMEWTNLAARAEMDSVKTRLRQFLPAANHPEVSAEDKSWEVQK